MTISEIAQLAGVSRAAVSRYLNDGYISEEKKERIKKVIEETGYRPSVQAQTLRTKKSRCIGVILPKINSEAVSRVVEGISSVLGKEGYQLLLANTENNSKKEIEFMNLLKNNNVEGIILIATLMGQEHKKTIKGLHMPIIVVGQETDYVSCIYHDDYHAAKQLTQLMIEKGCKKIGFIGVTEKDLAAGMERKRGYLEALKEAGLEIREEWIKIGDFSMQSGYKNMRKLIGQKEVPQAVFCATDTIAIGAAEYLKEGKIKIPQDIKIAGIGHNMMSRVVTPKLTTAHYHYKTSGIEAAKMLLEMLKEGSNVVKNVKLGFEVIEQDSTL